MRVLFVQQDHMSPTGPVGEAFTDHGFDVQEFMVVPEEHFHEPSVTAAFPDPLAFDAIVPMGAAWSVYDHDRIGTWIGDELDFLRRAHGAGVPVLGICFGGQALAAALGGMVVRAGRPEIGWTTVETGRRPRRAGAVVPVARRPVGPPGWRPRARADGGGGAGLRRGTIHGGAVPPRAHPADAGRLARQRRQPARPGSRPRPGTAGRGNRGEVSRGPHPRTAAGNRVPRS